MGVLIRRKIRPLRGAQGNWSPENPKRDESPVLLGQPGNGSPPAEGPGALLGERVTGIQRVLRICCLGHFWAWGRGKTFLPHFRCQIA